MFSTTAYNWLLTGSCDLVSGTNGQLNSQYRITSVDPSSTRSANRQLGYLPINSVTAPGATMGNNNIILPYNLSLIHI